MFRTLMAKLDKNAKLYIDEMPRRSAVFFALCEWVYTTNGKLAESIKVVNTFKSNPKARGALRARFTKIRALLLSHPDIDVLLDLQTGASERDKHRAIEPYVHAWLTTNGIPNPLDMILAEIETLLERQRLYVDDQAVPIFKPFLFAKSHKRNLTTRVDLKIDGLSREQSRSRKSALAVATYAAVQAVPDTTIPSGRKEVIEKLAWDAVLRRAQYTGTNADMLEAAVKSLVKAFDFNGPPFNSIIRIAVAKFFAELYRSSSIDRRMEISSLMATVCPMTPSGKDYMKYVAETKIDPAPDSDWSFFDGPLVASVSSSNLHLSSPIHLDRLKELATAFNFPDGTGTNLKAEPMSLAWGKTEQARKSNIDAFIKKGKFVQGKVMLVWSTYNSAMTSLLVIWHFHIMPTDNYANDVNAFLKAQEDAAAAKTPPPAGAKFLLAAWNLVTAAHAMSKTYRKLKDKTELTGADFLTIAKDAKGLVEAVSGMALVIQPDGAFKSTMYPAAARLLAVTGLVFTVADIGLNAKGFFDASKRSDQAVAIANIGGNTLVAASMLLGGLRTVPHPAAFLIGLTGQLVLYVAGWYKQVAARDEMIALLEYSYFSKQSEVKRKTEIFNIWLSEYMLLQSPSVSTATAKDDTGIQAPQVGYFGSEPNRLIEPTGALETAEEIKAFYAANRAVMTENWLYQIAVLYGASGAMKIVHNRGINESFDSHRKTIDVGDPARDKTKVPKETELEFYDTSHRRLHNATQLGQRLGWLEPLLLSKAANGAPGSAGATEWATAAHKALNEVEPHPILMSSGGLNPPDLLQARLRIKTPAWFAREDETPVNLQILQLVKIL